MTRTVVIGGGVAGLATAALLAREGHHVKLLERNNRVGGRVGVLERQGFRFDTGPSWYLMPRVFDHFFELMGTSTAEQLDLRTLDPGYKVFSEPVGDQPSEVVVIPYGVENVTEAFELAEPGSAEALRKYLKSAAKASQMAEDYFLYNPFTSLKSLLQPEVLRAVPRLFTLLGTSLQRFVSKRFSHPMLRQVLGYPAVFLGTEPTRAPAMYHLMSSLDLDEGVQYPIGGFWGFIERMRQLAVDAGVEIVTDADVTRILTKPAGKGVAVDGVTWVDRDGTEQTEQADYVVSGADLHHTETALLAPSEQSYPESWWNKIETGPGAVIALLGVKGELPELEHHTLFFTRDWQKNFDAIFGDTPIIPEPASIYVCKPSATEPEVAPVGHENLFVLIPIPADPSLGSGGSGGAGDEQIERATDAAIDQIGTWANIPNFRDRIVVRDTLGPKDFQKHYNSWKGGMLGPAHILKQSALFRAQNQSKKVEGLYYAGGTTAPGVGVPMCLISAEVVLKRIRGDRSSGPLPVSAAPSNLSHKDASA